MCETLYHYCSLDTFIAILKSKSIRMSDMSKSNDFMERKWILNFVEQTLNDFFSEKEIAFNLKEEFYYDDGIYSHLQYLLSEINMHIKNPSFITCFSTEEDLLSQWRAYADDGRGIAIGFNYHLLKEVTNGYSEIFLDKVIYDKDEQIIEIVNAAESGLHSLTAFIHTMLGDEVKNKDKFMHWFVEEFEAFGEVFASCIANASCIIKNPAFEEEKEFRLYYNSEIYDEIEEDELKEVINKKKEFNDFLLKKIDFFTRNNQVVGYRDLSFERIIDNNIISEVIIGPSSKVTVEDIRLLLVKHGLKSLPIHISKSKASYQIK